MVENTRGIPSVVCIHSNLFCLCVSPPSPFPPVCLLPPAHLYYVVLCDPPPVLALGITSLLDHSRDIVLVNLPSTVSHAVGVFIVSRARATTANFRSQGRTGSTRTTHKNQVIYMLRMYEARNVARGADSQDEFVWASSTGIVRTAKAGHTRTPPRKELTEKGKKYARVEGTGEKQCA